MKERHVQPPGLTVDTVLENWMNADTNGVATGANRV